MRNVRRIIFRVLAIITTLLVPTTGIAVTNFPTALDTPAVLGTAAPGTPIASWHHNNVRDAVIALQTKVGVDSSSDPTSIDYLLKSPSSVNPGHTHTGASLTNINAASITTGTLPDARLSSLIPRLNVVNSWTASQSFTAGITVTGTVTATVFSGSGASLTNIPETAIVDGGLLARVADNETITGNWVFSGSLTASGANITAIPEANLLNDALLARVADNETITGTWSFSANIAQIRGVPYTWPAANAAGVLANDGSGNLSWTASSIVAAGSTGAVQFNFGGTLGADTANFFWDDTNDRLGVRTSTPDEALTVSGGNVKAVRLISTVSSGTSPLVVASNTVVTNLNADLLDGIDSTAYAVLGDNETITGTWSFSANIAQIRGVPYTWPAANAAGVLANDGSGNLSWSSTVTSPAGLTGAVQFNSGGLFAADTSNFFWDDTNDRLGLGTSTPATRLHVEGTLRVNNSIENTSALTITGAGLMIAASGTNSLAFSTNAVTRFQITETGRGIFGSEPTPTVPFDNIIGYNDNNRLVLVTSGSGVPGLITYRSGGTLSAPTNGTFAGYTIGRLDFGSYDGSAFFVQAGIRVNASEAWSGTARGTDIVFATTPTGTTGLQTTAVINPQSFSFGVSDISRTFLFGSGTTGTDQTIARFRSGNSGTTEVSVLLNRGGTDVARWRADGTSIVFDYTNDLIFRSGIGSPAERARLTAAGIFEIRGTTPSLRLYGATSGNFTMSAAATTTTYSVVWPPAQGDVGSFLTNDGSGNLSWSPTVSHHFANVQTTDATTTTLFTISTTSNRAYHVDVSVVSRRTDAGSEAASYSCVCTYRNISGTLTEIAESCPVEHEDVAAWNVVCSPSGTDILVRVVGEASKTIGWDGHIRVLRGTY